MILGVDPGISGALAWIDGGDIAHLEDMPTMTVDIGKAAKRQVNPAILADLVLSRRITGAWVEKVHAMPGQGVTSMFGFGRSFGVVEGVLAALSIPVTLVTPQAWGKTMGVAKGKDGNRQRACELWPTWSGSFARVKDDGRADAALIAAHGWTVAR